MHTPLEHTNIIYSKIFALLYANAYSENRFAAENFNIKRKFIVWKLQRNCRIIYNFLKSSKANAHTQQLKKGKKTTIDKRKHANANVENTRNDERNVLLLNGRFIEYYCYRCNTSISNQTTKSIEKNINILLIWNTQKFVSSKFIFFFFIHLYSIINTFDVAK